MVLPGQLDRRLGDLRPAALELHGREIARRQLGQEVGELNRERVGAVHRRREVQNVELAADRLDHAPVVVADRGDVDAGECVEIALAVDVPVVHAVGPGHDQRMLRPFGHLVAHEDLPEESLLGRLGFGDQVGDSRGGGHAVSRFLGQKRDAVSRVKQSHAGQVFDRDPLVNRMLPTGAWAMRDRGHARECPEAVAVVHKRLRADG